MNIINEIKRHKTPLNFVNSTLFLTFVSILTSFVTYRFIEPAYLGIWATFTTFTTIATFLRLGIPNGMNRELPYYLGKGEKKEAYTYASTTFAYSLYITCVLFLIAVFFLLFFNFDKYGTLKIAYYQAAVVFFFSVIVEPYKTYLSGTFRTSANFDKLSRIQYIVGLLRLATIVLVYFYVFEGYLIREFLIRVIEIILYHFYRPLKNIKPIFKFSYFKTLFSIGFNMFAVSYVTSFIDTIPRLFIVKECDSMSIGLFSPVLVAISFVEIIPNSLASYLYPKLAYAYGQGCSKCYLFNKTAKLMLGSVILGLICSAVVYSFIDYVMILFPKYKESVDYIKIGCLAMAFIGHKVTGTVSAILKLYKWMWVAPICQGLVAVITIVLLSHFIYDSILIASYTLAVTYFIMFFVTLFVTYYITRK